MILKDLDCPVEVMLKSERERTDYHNLETTESCLDAFRIASHETSLISNIANITAEEFVSIAPGEEHKPVFVLSDKFCKERAHPYLFLTGKFDYKVEREILSSAVKYFNQRLLDHTQKFASDSNYIFFAHSVFQQLSINSQINIAMRNVNDK